MSDKSKSDVPPPRYTESGGWKELITDEEEWLARPALWGISKLPPRVRERRQVLCDYYLCRKQAELLACVVCRQPIADLWTEDGFEFTYDTDAASQLREWYARTHSAGAPKCDAWPVWRRCLMFHRGILTQLEFQNGASCDLYDAVFTSCMASNPPEWRAKRAVMGDWTQVLTHELIDPNPFRPVVFDPAWRSDTVVSLAKHIYESRDFGAMPILADALQDAGCEHAEILTHCRGNGPHVRGCWVVDLVLDKS